MSKKFEIKYGSVVEKIEEGSRHSSLLRGGHLIELFTIYESWNSQRRSKKCRKNRQDLKESFFDTCKQIDYLMNTHQIQYDQLIKEGVSPSDIEVDEEGIQKEKQEYWERMEKRFKN